MSQKKNVEYLKNNSLDCPLASTLYAHVCTPTTAPEICVFV